MHAVLRPLGAVIAVGLAACATALPPSAPAAAAAPAPVVGAAPDFDADGLPDLAYGMDDAERDAQAVVVRYANGRVQQILGTDIGRPAGNDFGTAILARDLNHDSYCDLVVTDHSAVSPGIAIVFGGPGGLDTSTVHSYPAPAKTSDAPNFGGKSFGGSLALLTAPTPLLVVGGQQTDVPGGSLAAYALGTDGLPAAPFWINQDTAGIPGTAEAGDDFGAAVVASGSTLVVGVPGEDIGTTTNAGNIVTLTYAGGQAFSGKGIGQNTTSVPGTASKNDRFGAALSMTAGLVAVGVPGEAGESGAVQLFTRKGAALTPSTLITQNSAGVPGSNAPGDRFGTAVALGTVCADGGLGVVVGAPAETHTSTESAGTAWVIPLKRTSACPATGLWQGNLKVPAGFYGLGDTVGVLKARTGTTNTVVLTAFGLESSGSGAVITLKAPFQPADQVLTLTTPHLNDKHYALSTLDS